MSNPEDILTFTPIMTSKAVHTETHLSTLDDEVILECVSRYIYNMLKADYNNHTKASAHATCIFTRKVLRLSFSQKTIKHMIEQFIRLSKLELVCLLPTIHYLRKYKDSLSTFCIQDSNWQCILLTALLVASKVWEDDPIVNTMIVEIMEELQINVKYETYSVVLKQVNQCEQAFIQSLDYQLGISHTMYETLWNTVFQCTSNDVTIQESTAPIELIHSPVSVSSNIHHSPIETTLRKQSILQQLLASTASRWLFK